MRFCGAYMTSCYFCQVLNEFFFIFLKKYSVPSNNGVVGGVFNLLLKFPSVISASYSTVSNMQMLLNLLTNLTIQSQQDRRSALATVWNCTINH